MKLIYELAVR